MGRAFCDEMGGIDTAHYERFVITFIRHLPRGDEREKEKGIQEKGKLQMRSGLGPTRMF